MVKNSKDLYPPNKTLEVINNFIKVVGNKINVKKFLSHKSAVNK